MLKRENWQYLLWGAGDVIAFIFRLGSPPAIVASFYKGILFYFFGGRGGGGGNTQSDAAARNDMPSACIRL